MSSNSKQNGNKKVKLEVKVMWSEKDSVESEMEHLQAM